MRRLRLLLILAAALLLAGAETRVGEAPVAEAAFSGANGKIVFWKGPGITHPTAQGIYTIHPDGTGLTHLAAVQSSYPKWSPNGGKMYSRRCPR